MITIFEEVLLAICGRGPGGVQLVSAKVEGHRIVLTIHSDVFLFDLPRYEKETIEYLDHYNDVLRKALRVVAYKRSGPKPYVYRCPECGKIENSNRTYGGTSSIMCRSCLRALGTGTQQNESFVYFLLNPGSNLVKIGCSTHLESRIRTISSMSGIDLVLLGLLPGGQKKEARLHRQFADLREQGEYFRYEADLVEFIDNLKQETTGVPCAVN